MGDEYLAAAARFLVGPRPVEQAVVEASVRKPHQARPFDRTAGCQGVVRTVEFAEGPPAADDAA